MGRLGLRLAARLAVHLAMSWVARIVYVFRVSRSDSRWETLRHPAWGQRSRVRILCASLREVLPHLQGPRSAQLLAGPCEIARRVWLCPACRTPAPLRTDLPRPQGPRSGQ